MPVEGDEGDSPTLRRLHRVVSRPPPDSKSKYFSPGRIKLPSMSTEDTVSADLDIDGAREPHASGSSRPALKKRSASNVPRSLTPLRKKKKPSRPYAPPEKYAHLACLPDHLKDDLDVVFCGINPAVGSSTDGHHYAHPTNHFWKCLPLSGFTGPITASEDHTLPEKYNLGLMNLIDRPTAEQSELSKEEMQEAVPGLITKIGTYKPLIVCFVGKVIWDHVGPYLRRKSQERARKRSFAYDLQPYKLVHCSETPDQPSRETLFFVVPSTSSKVVGYDLKSKAAMLTLLRSRLHELKAGTIDTTVMTPILISPAESATRIQPRTTSTPSMSA